MEFTHIKTGMESGKNWITHRLYRPLITRLALYLCRMARLRAIENDPSEISSPLSDLEWKQKALSDFNAWLTELPEEASHPESIGMESVDLYTLLSEFVALRQEIKMQNREQHQVLRIQQTLIDGHKAVADLFETKTRQLEHLEENIRRNCERKTIEPFLDIRDALCRGLSSARKAAAEKSLFRRPPKNMDGVMTGYEMALRRFDRALSYARILPVETVGKPFDATTMQAIDLRAESGVAPGIVLSEHLCGFTRGNEVIRTAQVVVSAPEKTK